jgi:hypothetical protein
MSDDEYRELKSYQKYSFKVLIFSVVLFYISLNYLIGYKQSFFNIFLIGIVVFIYQVYYESDFYMRVKRDLRSAVVKVITIIPKYVIKIEESEDEGVSFIIEDIDGDIILFSGQEMRWYEYMEFPWVEIKIVRSLESDIDLGVVDDEPREIDKTLPPYSISHKVLKELGAFKKDILFLSDEQKEIVYREIEAHL